VENFPPSPSGSFSCRACGHSASGRHWLAQERIFGLPGRFDYTECPDCGALSITMVPADLARFYPNNYYSFDPLAAAPARESWRDRLAYGTTAVRHALVRRLLPARDARILDVGSGSGRLLQTLHQDGYRNVCGIDPLLPSAQERIVPFPLLRREIGECEGNWDVIMYHHVLEHIADPRLELRLASARLRPGGILIIRVPLADSWARRKYGPCWVQWDAPRHLCLPTRLAIRRLAAENGLGVTQVIPDSTGVQVWASRLYRRGRLLNSPQNPFSQPRRRFFSALPGIMLGIGWAWWLNRLGKGDQACFVLQRPP
jgi:SAM-dependent methyltransferase